MRPAAAGWRFSCRALGVLPPLDSPARSSLGIHPLIRYCAFDHTTQESWVYAPPTNPQMYNVDTDTDSYNIYSTYFINGNIGGTWIIKLGSTCVLNFMQLHAGFCGHQTPPDIHVATYMYTHARRGISPLWPWEFRPYSPHPWVWGGNPTPYALPIDYSTPPPPPARAPSPSLTTRPWKPSQLTR